MAVNMAIKYIENYNPSVEHLTQTCCIHGH